MHLLTRSIFLFNTCMYMNMDKTFVFSSDKWFHCIADMKCLCLWRAKTYITTRGVLQWHN